MIRAIDNGVLITDLDGNHFIIRNLGTIDPPPPSVVTTDDSRLSDSRNMIDGSITNESISDDAAIAQSKLNLGGNIPVDWLGSTSTQAAQGDLVQVVSLKDAPNGYASLGGNGKMISGSTPTSGSGTLHTIEIQMPLGTLTAVHDTIATDTTFNSYWDAQSSETWLGNITGAPAPPTFTDGRVFPETLIPNFDASKITSETFAIGQVPMSVGVGVGHSGGLLPDPGSTATSPTAQPDDYIGRDMLYHPMKPVVSIQPTLPPPSIYVQSFFQNQAYINITSSVQGTNLFYKTDSDPFVEIFSSSVPSAGSPSVSTSPSSPTLPLLLPVGTIVSAYISKVGYNNSNIATYTVPPPGAF